MSKKLSTSTLEILNKKYSIPDVSLYSFRDDISRASDVARLLRRFKGNKPVSIRQIINSIVILYNVFGNYAELPLYEMVDDECIELLDTVLLFLGRDLGKNINHDFYLILVEQTR